MNCACDFVFSVKSIPEYVHSLPSDSPCQQTQCIYILRCVANTSPGHTHLSKAIANELEMSEIGAIVAVRFILRQHRTVPFFFFFFIYVPSGFFFLSFFHSSSSISTSSLARTLPSFLPSILRHLYKHPYTPQLCLFTFLLSSAFNATFHLFANNNHYYHFYTN